MGYNAEVIADSVSERGHRLTTLEATFPRIVLSEFNTHRVLSRNSASSRAIPVAKQLERIKNDPYIPEYWGKNQPGMKAYEQLGAAGIAAAKSEWLHARDAAVTSAEKLLDIGLHKQLANRILEPFAWHTVLVTATEWNNFYALRANPDAQPEIRTIAEQMQDAMNGSTPKLLKEGEWHLPLIQPDEFNGMFEHTEAAQQISSGRSARVSYMTHHGIRDKAKDIELYDSLRTGGHMSPLEHVARPFTPGEWAVREAMAERVQTMA
nr:Thymidylate synthase complementing protein [uncultured bacterium]